MQPCSRTPVGLDTDPESDPSVIFSHPAPPISEVDPGQTEDPFLRSLQIAERRAAGLPDYPSETGHRRSVAD